MSVTGSDAFGNTQQIGPQYMANPATGAASGATAGSSLGPWGAAIGGVAGAIGGFFGGGGSESTGLTLPPEYELQFFDYFNKQMEQLNQSYSQTSKLLDVYNSRANAAYGAMQGTIPSKAATKLLTQTSSELAQALGMSASDMVKNGFISPSEAPALQRIQDIAMQGTNFRGDAVTEQQISDQKRQLQQELARQGVPAAQQAIAMQQFEQSAGLRRQQAAQAQIGQLGGFLQTSSGLRQQGFQQAVGGLGAVQGQLDFTRQGLSGLAGMAQNQFSTNLAGQQFQQGLRQEGFQNYNTMGGFKFSDRTNELLSQGAIGPGSVNDQLAGRSGGGYSPSSLQNPYAGQQSGQIQTTVSRMSNEQLLSQYNTIGKRLGMGITTNEGDRSLYAQAAQELRARNPSFNIRS